MVDPDEAALFSRYEDDDSRNDEVGESPLAASASETNAQVCPHAVTMESSFHYTYNYKK